MVKILSESRVWTVEFRRRTKWDRGLPNDAVVVHEVRAGGEPFLLGGFQAGQRWVGDFAKGIGLVVDRIDTASSTATITI